MNRLTILPAIALALACSQSDTASRATTDTVAQVAPDTMLQPRAALRRAAPAARSDTVAWADTSKRNDTTFYARGRAITSTVVVVDTQWFVPPPPKPVGKPFGVWRTPADSVCRTGYGGALLESVRDTAPVVRAIADAKRCGVGLVLAVPGPKTRDANGLSVKLALAELQRWPWVAICAGTGDGSVRGILNGDDLTHQQWGSSISYATRLAMWDSMAAYVRKRCPAAATMERFRPSQVDTLGHPGYAIQKNVTTYWLQYTGPKRHKRVESILASEVAIAKRLGKGLVGGLNLLNGGCGPASTGDCYPGIPGTSAGGGTDLWQMSSTEVLAYGKPIVDDPYICVVLGWTLGIGDFFTKAANRAALDSLDYRARRKSPVSCKQP